MMQVYYAVSVIYYMMYYVLACLSASICIYLGYLKYLNEWFELHVY